MPVISLVLDSSIALAWTYADEATEAILRVFDEVRTSGAWVPGLWRWDVANVLEANVRRGRHSGDFRDAALSALAVAPIRVDREAEHQAWNATLLLAQRHRLTVYDASYLEIALRRRIALATLDRQLRMAAEKEGLQLLGM
jgi:predicted nucleic acid-binding protein